MGDISETLIWVFYVLTLLLEAKLVINVKSILWIQICF